MTREFEAMLQTAVLKADATLAAVFGDMSEAAYIMDMQVLLLLDAT